MVYAAYREYRAWREARIEQARIEARKEARDKERARVKRIIATRGITLPPEVASVLYGETDQEHPAWLYARIEQARKEGRNAERARVKRELAASGITLPPEIAAILAGEPNDNP